MRRPRARPLRLLPDNTARDRRLLLLIPLATALAATGRLRHSRKVLGQALDLFSAGTPSAPGPIIAMIARTEQDLGRADEARRLLARALAQAEPGSPEAITLTLERAENLLMVAEWDQAATAAGEARTLAQVLGDDALVVVATASVASARRSLRICG